MFQSTRRNMKWTALLKDIKEKVGLTPIQSNNDSSTSPSSHSRYLNSAEGVGISSAESSSQFAGQSSDSSYERGKYDSEFDFKRFWEEFRSSSYEKEKEVSLNMAVDIFCRLVKQQADVARLVNTLVETHIFSFVIGRAFVTDIEKLRIHSKEKSLHIANVMDFFSDSTKNGISPGSNLLCAVEALVSAPIDKQPLLDSGILSCLIYLLNVFLNPDDTDHGQFHNASNSRENISLKKDENTTKLKQLEVEGTIVHIMKALANHSSAALCLIENDSLQLLFQMVTTGSCSVFSRLKNGHIPLHTIQLYRHAMQILSLLLVNDNGNTAKYIQKHHLIKFLLMAVKDFNSDDCDPAYTMGIVDLIMECVELSYRPEAGSIRLKEDIHNSNGYQFLVQFALVLSDLHKNQALPSAYSVTTSEESSVLNLPKTSYKHEQRDYTDTDNISLQNLSPVLFRLLDVLVNLVQTGSSDLSSSCGKKGLKTTCGNLAGPYRSSTQSFVRTIEESWDKENAKVQDLKAIEMLQDIFLTSNSTELQAEVLERMFKIFSCHLDNYKLCQKVRTVPLFISKMTSLPASLQEIIFKILEYAVTAINCVPEQELLSLCYLLHSPITSSLKHAILSFFVKILSFDRQYKKILPEVGVLEVLIDDLKQHKLMTCVYSMGKNSVDLENIGSDIYKKYDNRDEFRSSPHLLGHVPEKFLMFEDKATVDIAWDCLSSLLKKSDANQSSFRSANGFTLVLPLLISDIHRSGVLRILSSLIIEDTKQVHTEELGILIEILKSGMITNELGSQYKLLNDAKCDILEALWRILGSNISTQRVFGDSTGFSLLLTTLNSFQIEVDFEDFHSSLQSKMKVVSCLLRVMTAAVCNNAINRLRLHAVISTHTFYDLLRESGLLSMDWENQVIQLMLEIALEIVIPPCNVSQVGNSLPSNVGDTFLSNSSSGTFWPDKERVYSGSAIGVLIRSLSLFTPKPQLDLLIFIQKLALVGPFNQESLTSVGCVGILLDTLSTFLKGSSSLLAHALQLIQILGAYRLSTSELRVLVRYILQMKSINSGRYLIGTMEKIIQMQDTRSEDLSLAQFMEMDMTKIGHASLQVSLGERAWPPSAGYSFVCWFRYDNFLKDSVKDQEKKSRTGYVTSSHSGTRAEKHILRIFSVGAVDDVNTFYAELYLQDNGVLTLATSNSSTLSFSGLEMGEGKWHHLAVVHSKPNALAGLFQASVAYLYLNGKLRHTGKLGYALSPIGRSLQVIIGTPVTHAKVSKLSWRLRSCYLFEEVLSPGSICFMYLLGRGYRGIFQDAELLQFVPNQACGGNNMAILDALVVEPPTTTFTQRLDTAHKQGNAMFDGSGIVWDYDRLSSLSFQLMGKKLIFAFDGTPSDAFKASGTLSMINLVDPLSASASSIGGIPRFGRLNGDSYICRQNVIGDSIRAVGGIAVILLFVEASDTKDMLHMALSLLACALHQNPHNVFEMQACKGYHLLAIFLHRKMPLFDMHSLEIFFHIAACDASFQESPKLDRVHSVSSSIRASNDSFEELSLQKYSDEFSSVGSHGDMDDFFVQKDSLSHFSEHENSDLPNETANCIVLSNVDMVEHVLLDWTLWVTSPVSIQLALLGFLEQIVSMHWYRNHNLTLLRQINLVQHLLVTLQRGDVEVQVLEKVVGLLGIILKDGFLASELELVVTFAIMTFDPLEFRLHHQISQEIMGKHVIVRNMLLEMLIDLQVTISSDELLDQWHKIVSSKLITYFLDEAVHPTSMRWIMTLLGVCLTSSSTFTLKFRGNGGYRGLTHVLPSFYDSPDIYYIIFCLIFGKSIYPRVPEVRIGDFHALMSSDGCYGELKFVELLEPVIAMAKCTFNRLSIQAMLALQNDNASHSNVSLVAEIFEATSDYGGDLQAEALKHKTSARLMGGVAAAPVSTTSVLRFMVDLAKMCPSFSSICRKMDFLESCVDLYFSCVRAHCAVKMLKYLAIETHVDRNVNNNDDYQSMQSTLFSLPQEQDLSSKTSISITSFPQGMNSISSEEMQGLQISIPNDPTKRKEDFSIAESDTFKEDIQAIHNFDTESIEQMSSITCSTNDLSFRDSSGNPEPGRPIDASRPISLEVLNSPYLSEKSSLKVNRTPTSPAVALTSWFSISGSNSEAKVQLNATSSIRSSVCESDAFSEPSSNSDVLSAVNTFFPINPKLLDEIDDSGYGGGPCSAAATAVLDFIAIVLADMISEQTKASQHVESILEAVPLYVDIESVLVYQGLCLSRLMNFLERRLLRDDEEDEKKLDKSRWSVNLDILSTMIVDRVYIGAFPQPFGVLRTLEFLFSMLQLANKDGHIEEAVPSGKGLLSIKRGSRQLDAYINSLLKNANRVILYCFFPSFLIVINDEKSPIDICTILQLIIANKRLVLCPSNQDNDLICCLCVNLFTFLRDRREFSQNLAVDIIKYMLLHRQPILEELLVLKSNQGDDLDVLHGGFDKLLTGSLSDFFKWLCRSESTISYVLEQSVSITWKNYIIDSEKFPNTRINTEIRRKKEMGKKSQEAYKLDLKYEGQTIERRCALEMIRDAMSTELRVIRQDKYGWVLHAESEWQAHLQQLVHERGIFPIRKSTLEYEWKLCPIEGPYRMRKKLEHCKLKDDLVEIFLICGLNHENSKKDEEKLMNSLADSELDFEQFFSLQRNKLSQVSFNDDDYDDSNFKDVGEFQGEESMSAQIGWDEEESSANEASLYSAAELEAKSSVYSIHLTDNINLISDPSSPKQSSSIKIDNMQTKENKTKKELLDNGEYLIRPFLDFFEKIRFKYNCERVVGLDKHDGIFLIGDSCLYVIENYYIDDSGCICEKQNEDELSVIDQALGVKKDVTSSSEFLSKSSSIQGMKENKFHNGRAWAYNGGAWGKEKVCSSCSLSHLWHMWKLDSVHELLKRDYQLRPVAIEIFSMDGCNDLLVFHKKERDDVFKTLVSMNLPRNTILDTTISGSSKQEGHDGGRLFKVMAKSFSKRWQNGEISNFQYLMHLNTLAGRGYSDLTQYPVFPWVLADYESDTLDLLDPKTFRKLDKPIGCQTIEGEEEFKKRYESWDDPDVPKFHYGSHYSSAGIVLFYLLRLPPFSAENQKLQGGQFDHADRLFNSIRDTWISAAGKGNTSDVKELIPEFFYMPEFLENRFNHDLGEKQSGEKVGDVVLPPWANGSVREFIKKHREALESDYVSENLHHWIDLIFGYKQRGKAAEEAVNVFYHYTYEGSVDIDSVSDPAMKASILAQINHFGQTPKQLFQKSHAKRQPVQKIPPHPLRHCSHLLPHVIRKPSSSISQIVTFHEKILTVGMNNVLYPDTYSKYIAWGFPDRSVRFLSYDQNKLLSTHEGLHGGNQIQCVGVSHDGQIVVTGAEDGVVSIWKIAKDSTVHLNLAIERALCAHTAKITCLYVSQPYTLIVTGSDDCTVILWDLSGFGFVKQLPQFPAPVSAIHVNDLTGEIVTASGILLSVWSINGDCLAVVNTSQLPSDLILSVTSTMYNDWQDTNWYVTGHQSGAVKVWNMIHVSMDDSSLTNRSKPSSSCGAAGFILGGKTSEYRLVLRKVLKSHKHPVTAIHLTIDYKQLLSGDSAGHLLSWMLPEEGLRDSTHAE